MLDKEREKESGGKEVRGLKEQKANKRHGTLEKRQRCTQFYGMRNVATLPATIELLACVCLHI